MIDSPYMQILILEPFALCWYQLVYVISTEAGSLSPTKIRQHFLFAVPALVQENFHLMPLCNRNLHAGEELFLRCMIGRL